MTTKATLYLACICSLAAFNSSALADGGQHARAGWRQQKSGKFAGGRYLTTAGGRGYYLVEKPRTTALSHNGPSGRGYGLFTTTGRALKKVSLVQVNPLKGKPGRTITVKRDQNSKGNLIALETTWEEQGELTSSGRNAGTLRRGESEIIGTENIRQLKMEQRHRYAGYSNAKKDSDGGGTTVTRGTDLRMFSIGDKNRAAEVKIAPVIIDAQGHRQVDMRNVTTVRFEYTSGSNSSSSAD